MECGLIRLATEECLCTCADSEEWLLCVSDYLGRLRQVYQWDECDVNEVGRRVLQTIKVVREKPVLSAEANYETATR